MSWTHAAPAQEIHFGAGVVDRAGEVLRRVGARDTLLITSPQARSSDAGKRLEAALGHGLVSCFDEVAPNAPAPVVQAAFLQARRDGVDSVVSLGGGSCADVAKAVCFFFEQEAGTPALGVGDRPALPHVAIPVTFVGAALTGSFWMTEPASGQARGGGGATLVPAGVLVDPDVVSATPPEVLVGSGVTALAQATGIALEPPTPEAAVVARAGAQRLLGSLPRLHADPTDGRAVADGLEGAVLAGRAMVGGTNPLGVGLARLLAGRTGTPHRTLVAPLLAPTVHHLISVVPDEGARLAQALEAEEVGKALADLVVALGHPAELSQCGVVEDDLDATARLAQSDPSIRRMAEDELRALLDDAA